MECARWGGTVADAAARKLEISLSRDASPFGYYWAQLALIAEGQLCSFLPVVAVTVVAVTVIVISAAHFVSAEISMPAVEVTTLSATWKISSIAVVWIVAVIYMAAKASVAMEPGAGSDKDAIHKPLRSVIPIWSTTVGSVVVVAVRTGRFRPNSDRYLGVSFRHRDEKQASNDGQ